ncbi:MAG: nitroreductase family protein [Phocaeicola sp.]|nr:nitroreductase family protein [Phocaeicola sp.]MDY5939684.1 nitroreductase family protein [Phocaeicola sp.]
MNSFQELIKRRRSTRKYTETPLTQDQVVDLLKAGLMAPTSKNTHSWQFIAVDDKEKIEQLSRCKPGGCGFMKDATLAIVVAGDPLVSDVWVEDASIAATFIQLQAEDLGLGSCWIQVRGRNADEYSSSDEYVHGVLNLPLPLQVLCIIAIGHKATEKPAIEEDSLLWEKVHINTYNNE